jgi:hypothetical protein
VTVADADPRFDALAIALDVTPRTRGSGCTAMGYTGGIPEYRRRCDEIAAAGYTGFTLA